MRAREIAIVGAGPVGLLAALAAIEAGLAPVVLERRSSPRAGSRSIGIHPPSIELLARLGVADAFLSRGVRVRRGHAIGTSGAIGAVAFTALPGDHRYVLTIAQEDTEAILREALEARAPRCVREGAEVTAIERREHGALVSVRGHGALEVAAVIACDGKRSAVRAALGIEVDGAEYPGAYAMGDFPDTTGYGEDAAVFLTPGGLVESFPLPGRRRRWVIRRAVEEGEASARELTDTIAERTGHALDPRDALATSSFRAERWLARALSSGPVALAGDAAHVVSPIGGQGMNLGWLGAARTAATLARALGEGGDPSAALARDAPARRREARAVARRAELNMWLGRPTPSARPRERMMRALLAPPCAGFLARMFTMRGLAAGV